MSFIDQPSGLHEGLHVAVFLPFDMKYDSERKNLLWLYALRFPTKGPSELGDYYSVIHVNIHVNIRRRHAV